MLAIDAYRMSGQLFAGQKRLEEATQVWRRALALAAQAEPAARLGSTAPDVARALADLCARHGLSAQATSLRAQAAALECPPPLESMHPAQTLGLDAAQGAE
jgi:hypothetical protein